MYRHLKRMPHSYCPHKESARFTRSHCSQTLPQRYPRLHFLQIAATLPLSSYVKVLQNRLPRLSAKMPLPHFISCILSLVQQSVFLKEGTVALSVTPAMHLHIDLRDGALGHLSTSTSLAGLKRTPRGHLCPSPLPLGLCSSFLYTWVDPSSIMVATGMNSKG